MKRIFVCFIVFLISCSSLDSVSSPLASSSTITFIVFSDTHIGKGVGSDGLNAVERLERLISDVGQYDLPMVVLGDLTNAWTIDNEKDELWYETYKSLMAPYRTEEVKGNHDSNVTKFVEKYGLLNWIYRWKNALFVGVSSLNKDGAEWMEKGITYNRTTHDFLAATVNSLDYKQTKYHFLFMHFGPDSTWPSNEIHGVSAKFSRALGYFSVAFHGHEGGVERVSLWYQTTMIKTGHLGSGKVSTDTYLAVQLNTANGLLTVVSHNFMTGVNNELFKGYIVSAEG